jgi:16S rRNA (cytidine1402-2'-O)-methyltransferase
MQNGKLILLPNLLDESLGKEPFLPVSVGEAVSKLSGLIAESEKSGRRYVRRFVSHEHMARIPLRLLNEHTPKNEVEALLEPMRNGQTWGLISDAGLPCIADPGADLVYLAHINAIDVETFVGPCSIIMALQLSGFSGQRFAFHGYLPREGADLELKIREVEKQSAVSTQIWMEAPYRSSKMLEQLKTVLQPTTILCVATQLTLPNQRIASLSVAKWRASTWAMQKEPAIFLVSRS